MDSKKNYYEILGVDKKASEADIKSAYRQLAKKYHPDLHPGDQAAAEKFKEINEANETLSDPQKRSAYDYELEHPGMGGMGGGFGGFGGFDGGGFGGFEDIFSSFFGGGFGGGTRERTRETSVGEDIQKEMSLSFMDAAKGCQKSFSYLRNEPCPTCSGTGAKNGTAMKSCSRCGGRGVVQSVQNTMFGRTIRQTVCPDCMGKGKVITDKCPDCKGKGYVRKETTVSFNIPAGVDNGSYIRKRGFGNAAEGGGQPGDLIVVFKIEPHKIFIRSGFDLKVELPISYETASLGGVVKVPTVDDAFDFTVPEGTQNGQVFTVRGKGIRSANGTGNLILKVVVEIPTHLTKDQKQKIAETSKSFDLKQYDKMKRYADCMESLYGEKPY